MMMWIMIRIVVGGEVVLNDSIIRTIIMRWMAIIMVGTAMTLHHRGLRNIEITMIQVTHQIDPIVKIVMGEIMDCLLHHNTEIMMMLTRNRIDRTGMIMWGQAADFHLRHHSTEIMMMWILHQADRIEEKDQEIVVIAAGKLTATTRTIMSFHLVGLLPKTTNFHLVDRQDHSRFRTTLLRPSQIEVIAQLTTFHPV